MRKIRETIYQPDNPYQGWEEGEICPHCGAEEIYGEITETEYGYSVDYQCDNCKEYL